MDLEAAKTEVIRTTALALEWAYELGAGYDQTERYRELLTATGDPPSDREQQLLAMLT